MTVRQEMLAAARRGARRLGPRADKVLDFLRSQQSPDGGFRDRSGKSDLYYTTFGLQAQRALGREPGAELPSYLQQFGEGRELDFVHLSCLISGWAYLPQGTWPADLRAALLEQLPTALAKASATDSREKLEWWTGYGCFLSFCAYQDLEEPVPHGPDLAACLAALQLPDGSYALLPGLDSGMTTVTGGAATVLRSLGEPVAPATRAWLLAQHDRQGGFRAGTDTPTPDLLSTAVALFALSGLGEDLSSIRGPCREFIVSLGDPSGGYHGDRNADPPDCEYTFYALAALGVLG